MDIKALIKDNHVCFVHYRKGYLYYAITRPDGISCEFPVPIDDCGDATFPAHEKAIIFMRYIRQAIKDNTLVPLRAV